MLTTLQDSVDLIPPVPAGPAGNLPPTTHPIALTIIRQLAQDLARSIGFAGSSDSLQMIERKLVSDNWLGTLITTIESSIHRGDSSFIVIDFGDAVENWESEPANTTNPTPFRVFDRVPTLSLVVDNVGIWNSDPIHPSRYIEIENPYPFNLRRVLNNELWTFDRISQAIANNIEGGGQVQVGIDNLFSIVARGGTGLMNLTKRMFQLKSAGQGTGVIAYDRGTEQVTVVPRQYHREHESIQVVKDRIVAITGIPSFTIWGTTEGGSQFGIDKSLSLYSQRIGSIAGDSLGSALTYLAQILSQDPDVYFRPASVFGETSSEATERLIRKVEALDIMRNAGSINAIEMRDSMSTESSLGLVLNPSPQIITTPTATT